MPKKRKPWGGARDGAGRPKSQDPTVPVRLPRNVAEFVKGNIDLIRKMMEKKK